MGSTSPNTGYAVPLRYTHIAIATSHIQKRYTQFKKYFSFNKEF